MLSLSIVWVYYLLVAKQIKMDENDHKKLKQKLV